MLAARFSFVDFIVLGFVPSRPTPFRIFIVKAYWIFVEDFFWIYCSDHVIIFLKSIYITYLMAYIESSQNLWDKANLIMVDGLLIYVCIWLTSILWRFLQLFIGVAFVFWLYLYLAVVLE